MDGEPARERHGRVERLSVTFGRASVALDGAISVGAVDPWRVRWTALPTALRGAVRDLSAAERETLEVLDPWVQVSALAPGERVRVEGRLQTPESDPSRGGYRGEAPRWRLLPNASGTLEATSLRELTAPVAMRVRLLVALAGLATALVAVNLAGFLALKRAEAQRGPVVTQGSHQACRAVPQGLFALAATAQATRGRALDGWLFALRCAAPRAPEAPSLVDAILVARGAGCEARALEAEAFHDFARAASLHQRCGTPSSLRRAAMLEANLGRFGHASALLERLRAPSVELPALRRDARIHVLAGEPLRAAQSLQGAVDFLRRGSPDEDAVRVAEGLQDLIDLLRASRGDARARARVDEMLVQRRARGEELTPALWAHLSPDARRAWLREVPGGRAFDTVALQVRAFAEEPSLVPAPEEPENWYALGYPFVSAVGRFDGVLAALRGVPSPLWRESSRWHAAVSRDLAVQEARLGDFSRAHALLREDRALAIARGDSNVEGMRDAQRRAVAALQVARLEGRLEDPGTLLELSEQARAGLLTAEEEALLELRAWRGLCQATPALDPITEPGPWEALEVRCRQGPAALHSALRTAQSGAEARELAWILARRPELRAEVAAWVRHEDRWVDLEDPTGALEAVTMRVSIAAELRDVALQAEVGAVARAWREALRRREMSDVWEALK
jgi:NTP pyrophosphatase (non-canonical NTP hydrolase)